MVEEVKRYDVVLVDFGSVIGSEQGGIRPAVVVQNNKGNIYSSTTIVIPMTSRKTKHNIPTHAPIRKGRGTGLKVDSTLLGECIRQVSKERIVSVLGSMTDEEDQNLVRTVYFNSFEFGE